MSVVSRYQRDIACHNFIADADQLVIAKQLDKFLAQLITYQQQNLLSRFFKPHNKPKSIYLWGGVGRGKTYLMDLLYESVALQEKRRMHFHHFMQFIHGQLNDYRQKKNPLEIIASNMRKEFMLLCLDELIITDIADAMMMSTLFEALFNQDLYLVITSNCQPKKLYWDGLQREKFLPAIALLENKCEVLCLNTEVDYRLKLLKDSTTYFVVTSANQQVIDTKVEQLFSQISGEHLVDKNPIIINERKIDVVRSCDRVCWFEFSSLCETSRSVVDYIEIARTFPMIFVTNIPHLTDEKIDAVKRFIHLIDAFYEHKVKIVISTTAELENLYQGKRLAFEFARTQSRLFEMQATAYLSSCHLA